MMILKQKLIFKKDWSYKCQQRAFTLFCENANCWIATFRNVYAIRNLTKLFYDTDKKNQFKSIKTVFR